MGVTISVAATPGVSDNLGVGRRTSFSVECSEHGTISVTSAHRSRLGDPATSHPVPDDPSRIAYRYRDETSTKNREKALEAAAAHGRRSHPGDFSIIATGPPRAT